MRIAIEIDYSSIGIRGSHHLLRHVLQQFASFKDDNEYLLFGYSWRDPQEMAGQYEIPQDPRFQYLLKRWPQSLVQGAEWGWGLPFLETYLGCKGVDVFHCFRTPRWGWGAPVLTVADVWPVIKPEWTTPETRSIWEKVTLPSIRRARHIVTYCESTYNNLIQDVGIPKEKVSITPLAVDPEVFYPIEDADRRASLRKRYNLPEQFFLMVGPLDTLTNFGTVVKALKMWKAQGGCPPIAYASPIGDYVRSKQAVAEKEGVGDMIQWLGRVAHEDLAVLYSSAAALIYPGELQGAELPPFEAMACGCPVISSLRDNLKDSGILIDHSKPEELFAGMEKVLSSETVRRELKTQGLKRVKPFTWENTARATLRAYAAAVKNV